MRVATFLSAAAIAAAASIGPALAYGPAASGPSLSNLTGGPEAASLEAANQQTQVAYIRIRMKTNGYYVMVQGDNMKNFPGCEKNSNCVTTNDGLVFEDIEPDCASAIGGCVIVGKPTSE